MFYFNKSDRIYFMKKILWTIFGLGLIGFFDSLYLFFTHFTNKSVICDGTNECSLVLTSSYSSFFGFPVAGFGVIFYAYIIIITMFTLERIKKGSNLSPKFITPVAFGGFLASAWFVYLQAFIIGAYCTYCLVSAATSTLIFIAAVINCKKHKPEAEEITEN
jgi:uncharacterized membrane protein